MPQARFSLAASASGGVVYAFGGIGPNAWSSAVDAVCETSAVDAGTMWGYCFGGLLSVLSVAGNPGMPVRNLLVLGGVARLVPAPMAASVRSISQQSWRPARSRPSRCRATCT